MVWHKQKDVYDVYYCIRNYPDGIEALAEACKPLLEHASGLEGYKHIAEKFDGPDGYVKCDECSQLRRGDRYPRSADQWQTDAFGQVNAWLRAVALRG